MIKRLLIPLFLMISLFSPLLGEEDTPVTVVPEGDVPELSHAEYSKQFTKTVIIVIVLAVGILGFVYVLRRFSSRRPLALNQNKNIKVLERRHLSPNTFLYHIEVGGKQFILAESKFHIKTVATLDWSEEDSQ